MGFHHMGGGMSSYLEEQKLRGRKTDAQTVRRVMLAFKPYRIQVLLVLLAIILTTLLGLVNPLLIERVFDDAIGGRNLSVTYHLCFHYDHHPDCLRSDRCLAVLFE